MQEENWKHQWLLLCFARLARKTSMERLVAKQMRSNQNPRASWKPVKSQECEWKNLYRKIMRTTSQEQGTIRYSISIWYTNLFLCLKQWRYPQLKQQRLKNGKILQKIPAWDRTKVRNKSEVIDEARKEGRKVHFASLMDLCHLLKSNWRQSTKHTKIELYSEATLWKMILDRMQYSLNKDHQHHKWQQQKS